MLLPHLVPGVIVTAAIAPALLLLWLVIAADERPEPPRVIWVAFGLGALGVFPAAIVEELLLLVLKRPDTWLGIGETSLFFIAITEEAIKVALIAVIALRARDFDEPMDGVVYGAAVGLGFAACENLFYLVSDQHWEVLAVVRGALTVPFHGALGAIAGSYIASARFGGALGAHRHGHWARGRRYLLAWLIPVVLHALFDFGPLTVAANVSSGGGAAALEIMGVLVGIGAMTMAIWRALHIADHQRLWSKNSRPGPQAWRRIWALLVAGGGVGFVGAALAISGVTQWAIAGLFGLFMLGVGVVLLVLAVVIYIAARKHLMAAIRPPHAHPPPLPTGAPR